MIKLDLDNYIIPMENFALKWRFTEEKYDTIAKQYFKELKPLNPEGSEALYGYLISVGLHDDFPFKKSFFGSIDKVDITLENRKEIIKWLSSFPINSHQVIYLSWNETEAMLLPWNTFVEYFDSFYYAGSDDLTITINSLEWAVLFHHSDSVYFGSDRTSLINLC